MTNNSSLHIGLTKQWRNPVHRNLSVQTLVLFRFILIYAGSVLYKQKIVWQKLKRYWRLYKKLLYGSFTLAISEFSSRVFLYTDVFIIKLFSKKANINIATNSLVLEYQQYAFYRSIK